MHKTMFSRELRLLLCPQCGAPIEGALTGGTVSCRYCGATGVLAPRDESRDAASAAAQPAVSEAERFQRLREQEHKPLLPPPALRHLCVEWWLPPEHVAQGFAEFQRARQEVAAGGSFGAAERLYFLAIVLYEHLAHQGRDADVRALLETARDVLSDPRHRQVLHGMLARNAARAGDPAAAEEWLRLLTPHATDLHMDTAYRFSRAYLSTRAGDMQTVLRVLGTRVDDVPIVEPYDEVCAVLRANALERTGNGQAAVQALAQVASGHPAGADRLAQIAAMSPELGLCPQSLPAVRGWARR
jgi:uncharacterized Zn finger protein (UPF0148 family)